MATTRKKTPTPPEREVSAVQQAAKREVPAVPQAASRSAGRTTTARTAGRSAESGPPPSWERVSRRAFELWQQAGQPQGRDLEHWLQAEAELRGE